MVVPLGSRHLQQHYAHGHNYHHHHGRQRDPQQQVRPLRLGRLDGEDAFWKCRFKRDRAAVGRRVLVGREIVRGDLHLGDRGERAVWSEL